MLLAPHPSYTSPPQQAARSSSHSVPALTGDPMESMLQLLPAAPQIKISPLEGGLEMLGGCKEREGKGVFAPFPGAARQQGRPEGKSRSGSTTAALSRPGLTVGCAGRAPCRWAAVTNGRPRGRRRAGRRRTSAAAALRSGGERLRLSQARAGAGRIVL